MSWRTLILLLWMTVEVQAHSLHQSTAEAEWNAETKKLEVSLTVFVNDLELALMRQSEREMRIEKTAAELFDAELRLYLGKTFVVTDEAGWKADLIWVGRELDADTKFSGDPTMTVYFEFLLPEGIAGARVNHAVLSDLFLDELNLLFFLHGAQKSQLSFRPGELPKPLIFGRAR